MLMRRTALILALSILPAFSANAAGYARTDGIFVDPILTTLGFVHSYAGIDLEPLANLQDAELSNAHLASANLSLATLDAANLNGANLSAADLTSATVVFANLAFASLDGAVLSDGVFAGADFFDASLVDADLVGANLRGANMNSADLSSANLREALLFAGNLLGSSMSGADLSSAELTGTDLSFVSGLASTFWVAEPPTYDPNTNFFGTGFDPSTAGWVLVPEPEFVHAIMIGAAMLVVARRGRDWSARRTVRRNIDMERS